MLFQSFEGIARTILVGILAYVSLIILLRISGKRTLSKMNAFDLVVTVALGSTLATILLSKDVALAEGVAAFFTLIVLQYAITWSSYRSQSIASTVKSEPVFLYYRGEYLDKKMKSERILPTEVRAAVRSAGISSLEDVLAVILETDGSFSVIPQTPENHTSALEGVLKN